MILTDIRATFLAVCLFSALTLAAGPTMAVGAVVAVGLLIGIYAFPVVGVGLMILTGTALQVLGSEHLTGLPISLGKIVGVLTFVTWATKSLYRREPLTYSPQFVWMALFIATMAFLAQFSPDKGLAYDGLFRYAQLVLLYFMIANIAGASSRALDQICLAFSLSMVVAVFIGLAEFFLPTLAIEQDDPSLAQGAIGAILDHDSIAGVDIKRITGGLSDSNWFAYTLAGALPLNLYLFHSTRNPWSRLIVVAMAALQIFGIVLSLTRSALIAVAVSVAVLIFKRRLPLAPILVTAFLGAAATLAWSPAGIDRLFSTQYLKEGSTPLREYLLLGGVALIRDQPIFGYGYSEFGPAFLRWLATTPLPESVSVWAHWIASRVASGEDQAEWIMPHNTLLQLGVEYGLLGLAVAIAFFVSVLRDLSIVAKRGSSRQAELADCLLAAIWGFLVCAMFGHLALLKVMWILAGLAAALRRVTLQSLSSVSNRREPSPMGAP